MSDRPSSPGSSGVGEPVSSGVGVLDKAMTLLHLVGDRPRTLAQLTEGSGLSRATTHRLARALEMHRLVRRDGGGRYVLGLGLVRLGAEAARAVPLAETARPAMEDLRQSTGESVQLYVREGDRRVCVAALESPHGLRTIVPVGAVMPLDAGSAGRVLAGEGRPGDWVETVEERLPGVASVSAPVVDSAGEILAAVGVSGPIDRTTRSPGERYGDAVLTAARAISDLVR